MSRTIVAGDCGSSLPKGPATCNIGILIAPVIASAGQSFNQTLSVNYQGRVPLVGNITFSIPTGPSVAYVTNQLNNDVYLCPIDSNGNFDSCVDSGSSGVNVQLTLTGHLVPV